MLGMSVLEPGVHERDGEERDDEIHHSPRPDEMNSTPRNGSPEANRVSARLVLAKSRVEGKSVVAKHQQLQQLRSQSERHLTSNGPASLLQPNMPLMRSTSDVVDSAGGTKNQRGSFFAPWANDYMGSRNERPPPPVSAPDETGSDGGPRSPSADRPPTSRSNPKAADRSPAHGPSSHLSSSPTPPLPRDNDLEGFSKVETPRMSSCRGGSQMRRLRSDRRLHAASSATNSSSKLLSSSAAASMRVQEVKHENERALVNAKPDDLSTLGGETASTVRCCGGNDDSGAASCGAHKDIERPASSSSRGAMQRFSDGNMSGEKEGDQYFIPLKVPSSSREDDDDDEYSLPLKGGAPAQKEERYALAVDTADDANDDDEDETPLMLDHTDVLAQTERRNNACGMGATRNRWGSLVSVVSDMTGTLCNSVDFTYTTFGQHPDETPVAWGGSDHHDPYREFNIDRSLSLSKGDDHESPLAAADFCDEYNRDIHVGGDSASTLGTMYTEEGIPLSDLDAHHVCLDSSRRFSGGGGFTSGERGGKNDARAGAGGQMLNALSFGRLGGRGEERNSFTEILPQDFDGRRRRAREEAVRGSIASALSAGSWALSATAEGADRLGRRRKRGAAAGDSSGRSRSRNPSTGRKQRRRSTKEAMSTLMALLRDPNSPLGHLTEVDDMDGAAIFIDQTEVRTKLEKAAEEVEELSGSIGNRGRGSGGSAMKAIAEIDKEGARSALHQSVAGGAIPDAEEALSLELNEHIVEDREGDKEDDDNRLALAENANTDASSASTASQRRDSSNSVWTLRALVDHVLQTRRVSRATKGGGRRTKDDDERRPDVERRDTLALLARARKRVEQAEREAEKSRLARSTRRNKRVSWVDDDEDHSSDGEGWGRSSAEESSDAKRKKHKTIASFDWLNLNEYNGITSYDDEDDDSDGEAPRPFVGKKQKTLRRFSHDDDQYCCTSRATLLLFLLAAAVVVVWTFVGVEIVTYRSDDSPTPTTSAKDFAFDPAIEDYIPHEDLKPKDVYPPVGGECVGCEGKHIHHVVVVYNNEKGREVALDVAIFVHLDLDREGMLAIDVTADGLEDLQESPHIESVSTDYPIEAVLTPEGDLDDEDRGDRHRSLEEKVTDAITLIQADLLKVGHSPKTVCIADTGYALGHPDLPSDVTGSNITLDGVGTFNWCSDTNGHGSHMAGVCSAIEGNNMGLRGVGQIPLHITRGLRDDNRGSIGQLMRAVQQCADHGANVIVLSLGCHSCGTPAMESMFNKLVHEQGIMVVAAAGNNNSSEPFYPASHNSVISVAASDSNLDRYRNSNHNPQVELTAKGVAVFSTAVNAEGQYGFTYMTGTSMAAPIVAAGAAMLWSHFPHCTNQQIRNALAKTAKDIGDPGCDEDFGFGLVQLKAAYDLLTREDIHCGGESILTVTDITCPTETDFRSANNRAPERPVTTTTVAPEPHCVAESPTSCVDYSGDILVSHYKSGKIGRTCAWMSQKLEMWEAAKKQSFKKKKYGKQLKKFCRVSSEISAACLCKETCSRFVAIEGCNASS